MDEALKEHAALGIDGTGETSLWIATPARSC